jgi:molybdopterin-binding protein
MKQGGVLQQQDDSPCFVILGAEKGATMKLSARNVLKGKVKKVTHGAVNSEIVLELTGGVEVVSIITRQSAESLGLAEGKEAWAVIKASNVMIAVD